MSPTGTAPDDPGVVAATQLLTDLRGEITRADAKATILVGVLGMSAGVLCALLIGRGWSPALLSAPAALLWWAGTALLVTALFASLLAVIPAIARIAGHPAGHSPISATYGRPPGPAGSPPPSQRPGATPGVASCSPSPRRAVSPPASTSGSGPG